jgi:hypothetical protein
MAPAVWCLAAAALVVSFSAYPEDKPTRIERAADSAAQGVDRTVKRSGKFAEKTATRSGKFVERTATRAGKFAERTATKTENAVRRLVE